MRLARTQAAVGAVDGRDFASGCLRPVLTYHLRSVNIRRTPVFALGDGGGGIGSGWLALCLRVCAIVTRSLECTLHFNAGREGSLQRGNAFEAA